MPGDMTRSNPPRFTGQNPPTPCNRNPIPTSNHILTPLLRNPSTTPKPNLPTHLPTPPTTSLTPSPSSNLLLRNPSVSTNPSLVSVVIYNSALAYNRRQAHSVRVPLTRHRGAARQEQNLVGEESELFQGEWDVGWLSEEGKSGGPVVD